MKKYFPWVIVALALASALYAWYWPKEIERPRTEYREVTKTVFIKVPVKVADGTVQGTGAQLNNKPVIATGDCPASKTGSEIVTTITPSTGEAEIFIRPKPVRLFAFEDQKELGLRYNGIRAGIFSRWTFMRVGAFYGALYAEANTKPDAQLMVEVSYRW